MKKNIFIKIALVALIVLSGLSCDTQDFRDLDNPKHRLTSNDADMSMMLTRTIIDYGRNYTAIGLEGYAAKYLGTYSIIGNFGGLNMFSAGTNDGPWDIYSSGLVNVATLEDYLLSLDDPNQVNNLAMVRIMKCAIFQRLADYFGDIPYSECAQLLLSDFELNKPAYDTQEFIYKDILATLEREAANLTASSAAMAVTWTAADLSYGGKIEQWKKFAYSIMLRMAMRMSDVDETTAKRYAELAIANGVIVNNDDNYAMKTGTSTNPDERNPYSSTLCGISTDPERYHRLGQYFVDMLKDMQHPIRKIYFGGRLKPSVPDNQVSSQYQRTYLYDIDKWDWDLDETLGMRHGTITNPEESPAAYFKKYAAPNQFFMRLDLPHQLFPASEMLLLIAEAAIKGWNTGSYTAEDAFEAGVKAHMTLYTASPGLLKTDKPSRDYPNMDISEQEMDDYLASRPFGSDDATQKRRIAEEMYIIMFMNPSEGLLNIIRMGVVLPKNADIYDMPRRHAYPQNERANNYDKLSAAMTRRGIPLDMTRENEMQLRNWWDVATKPEIILNP